MTRSALKMQSPGWERWWERDGLHDGHGDYGLETASLHLPPTDGKR